MTPAASVQPRRQSFRHTRRIPNRPRSVVFLLAATDSTLGAKAQDEADALLIQLRPELFYT